MTPTVNGELVNRVQQLRLDNQLGTDTGRRGGGGGSWLPWLLCGLLAASWVGVGVRYYRTPGGARSADSTDAGAKQPNAAAPQAKRWARPCLTPRSGWRPASA